MYNSFHNLLTEVLILKLIKIQVNTELKLKLTEVGEYQFRLLKLH